MSSILGSACTGQVLHSGERIFVIKVQGGAGVTFSGSYLLKGVDGRSNQTNVAGTVPAEFRAQGSAVFLQIQNHSAASRDVEIRVDANGEPELDKQSASANNGPYLEASISENGTLLKQQRTDVPHGVISLTTAMPPSGLPRETQIIVDGTAKFASMTLTSETGDAVQQLVPIPFTKTFFPREGWIVSVVAQKVTVTRLDPFRTVATGPIVQVLGDGRAGSLRVEVRELGGMPAESQTSEPFGVASVTVPIQ